MVPIYFPGMELHDGHRLCKSVAPKFPPIDFPQFSNSMEVPFNLKALVCLFCIINKIKNVKNLKRWMKSIIDQNEGGLFVN